MTVLREGRVVWHIALQAQPAEPAIGEVQMHLLAEPAFRTDAEAIADDKIRIISSGSIEGRPISL
jgi:hypothetical protein